MISQSFHPHLTIDLKKISNSELKVDWAEYVEGEEWDTLVKTASAGLDMKRAQHIKGKGKGEGKGTSKGSKGDRH